MTLITIDRARFRNRPVRVSGAADRDPVPVRHSLQAGGLFDLERLAILAGTLPAVSVEHNMGSVAALLPGGAAPQLDLSPAQIVRSIDSNGCWMVLKNVEFDTEYAALLNACLDDVELAVTSDEGRSVLREGFIFLSAPGSTTPVHVDPEHNVLLQLTGRKTMSIGRFADDDDLHRKVEALYAGGHRNLDHQARDLVPYALGPGDGIYVPVHAPHLVTNGDAVSVSLSITWRTRRTQRAARVYAYNAARRARGGSPAGPGTSRTRDQAVSAWQVGRDVLTRLRPVRGVGAPTSPPSA